MGFRNGCVYRKGRMFKDMVYIKIIQRNSSRTNGLVVFKYHNSSDKNTYKEHTRELKGFKLYNR